MLRSLVCVFALVVISQYPSLATAEAPTKPANQRAALEANLAKMLSGATLKGSFTVSGRDTTNLSSEKYTLGEVRKLDDKQWLIPARIEYGGKDVQLPLSLPIEWAGDTPIIVVDNVGLPGFGVVSARVMFFDDHYAGYWRHGEVSGNLFGVIHRAKESAATGTSSE